MPGGSRPDAIAAVTSSAIAACSGFERSSVISRSSIHVASVFRRRPYCLDRCGSLAAPPGCYVGPVRLVAEQPTLQHVADHGGDLYLWARGFRCCAGRSYVLEASTTAARS